MTLAAAAVKLAVRFVLPVMVNKIGLLVPLAAPLQLANAYPVLGLAVKVTLVPWLYWLPQFGPGEAVTVPLPVGETAVVTV